LAPPSSDRILQVTAHTIFLQLPGRQESFESG